MNLHEELKIALEAVAEPGRAAPMQAYMRDQFVFLGVAAPQRRLAVKALLANLRGVGADVLLEHAQLLWQQPQREYQHVALDMLALHRRQLGVEHLPALLGLARQRAWWDSVDGMAGIVGDVLQAELRRRASTPRCVCWVDRRSAWLVLQRFAAAERRQLLAVRVGKRRHGLGRVARVVA